MAGEEEDYGSARITIDLDDSGAVADASSVGQRIEQAIDRATRNIGATVRRNIERGLTAVSVRVDPDTGRFDTRLQRALRGLTASVDVAPDTSRFQIRLDRALRGLTASVDVTPDTSRFQTRLQTALRGLGSALTVPVTPDASGFTARLQTAVTAAGPVTVQATVDGDRLRARIQTALRRATLSVTVTPDTSRFQARINRAMRSVTANVRVEPDVSRFAARLRLRLRALGTVTIQAEADAVRFRQRLERALRALPPISIRVDPDLTNLNDALRRHNAPPVVVPVDPDRDRFTRALTGMIGSIGGVAARAGRALTGLLKFGAIGIAAAGAASGVGAFLAALAPAAGIVAALPAVIAGAAVAMNTLKLATMGVGDALKAGFSGDAEKFAEALEKLSPAARTAVTAVKSFQPELKKLQQNVQESFFKQFAADIGPAIKNLLPLGKELNGVSTEFGKAASEGLKFAASQQALGPLRTIIQGTRSAVSGLSTATAPLAKGFLDVAAAVLKAFGPGVGKSIAQTGASLGTSLSAFAESGRAVEWVKGAVAVFKQLGEIAGNIGGIISGAFRAGETAGAGLLNNLALITGQIREFVNSDAGQSALANIFRTIGTVAAQLGPILSAVVTQVGAIAPALAPLFQALGPAIVQLINALGPALAAIAPSLASLGPALAQGLAAIGPALGPLGSALGQVITSLAPLLPIIGELAGMVASLLAPAFSTIAAVLQPVIAQLAAALLPILPPITQAFTGLLQALIPLGVAIGQALGQAVQGLAPLLAQLAQVIVQVVVAITPLVAQIIAALLPALPPLIAAFNAIVAAVIPLLPPILGLVQAIVPLVSTVVSLAAPLLKIAAAFVGWAVINIVVPIIAKIVSALGGLIGIVTTVVNIVTAFTKAVVAGFKWLYNTLVGHSIIPDLVNGIIRWIRQLPGRALAALSNLVSSILGPIRSAASQALAAARKWVSDAVAAVKALPGRARSALSGIGSALVSAGRDLIRGMINGVKEMAGNIASAAKEVVSGAISSAKNALGISSPSRVFAQIGRDTGRGFIEGLTGTSSKIKATTDKIAKSIIRAFEGRRTRLDDRLVALVDSGNRRLQKLAAQRDALTKKIADAQKFAAETTKSALEAFSLSNIAQGQETVTAKTLTAGLEQAVQRVKTFSAQLNNLARRGLRKDLLQQIVGLGPEQGAQLAEVLSKTTKDNLKRLNNLQGQLVKATGTLGNTSADVLFDAGTQAGKGFLAGLKGQRKSIEKLMLDIAKGMQAAIRTALRIKSPSRVFMKIGDMTGAGLHIGLLRRMAALQDASAVAARSLADGVQAQLAGLGGGVPAGDLAPLTRAQRARRAAVEGAAGRRAGSGSGGTTTIVNNWEIREVGDAHMTAKRVLNRLVFAAGVSG